MGGFGSWLCQTALHRVLASKMTYCATLVYLTNAQLFTYRIFVYLVVEHLYYLYIVFLHSYGLWMPWWLCFISLTFNMFFCLFYVTEFCKYIVWRVFFFSWFQDASTFLHNTLSNGELQICRDGLSTGQACISTEGLSRNYELFVSTNQECYEFFLVMNTCKYCCCPKAGDISDTAVFSQCQHNVVCFSDNMHHLCTTQLTHAMLYCWYLEAAVRNLRIVSQSSKQDPKSW